MIEKTVTEMDQEEFDALIDAYIDRAAGNYGEMAVDVFLNLLLDACGCTGRWYTLDPEDA